MLGTPFAGMTALMGVLAMPGGRASFTDTPEGLGITVPAERQGLMLLFVAMWVAGWAVGEGIVIRQLFFSGPQRLDFGTIFLVFWLVGWTIGGAVAIRAWLWNAFGKERIVLRPATLTVKRDILGVGRERRYDLPGISNLRLLSATRGARDRSAPVEVTGARRVAIAFDYRGDTVYFGEGLDESEASFIVERLKTRHAFR